MKYKVIAKINDGIICATKSVITCFVENSLEEYIGQHEIGDIIPQSVSNNADFYWKYSRKEWDQMNRAFRKIRL